LKEFISMLAKAIGLPNFRGRIRPDVVGRPGLRGTLRNERCGADVVA